MRFRRSALSIPYVLFLLLFVVLPLFVVCFYAFTDGTGHFSVYNFAHFFTNTKTLGTLFYSVVIALVTTVCCLLLAYPTAYILAKGPLKHGAMILFLYVMPMWINFTLRIMAMKEILSVLEGNLAYYPFLNTILGMTYDFLPFMIMPIYNSISKLDDSICEAAQDLGAKNYQVILKVMIPMSMPGIISGITMVFLPAMTNYVVLDMMYNSTYIMGSLIGSYFSAYDWHNGSMISVILLILIFIVSFFTNRMAKTENQRGGSAL